MEFKDLNFVPLLKVLQLQQYSPPLPIQQGIPAALAKKDSLACTHTSFSKTTVYTLPALQSLYCNKKNGNTLKHIKALIHTRIRELAIQIEEGFKKYLAYAFHSKSRRKYKALSNNSLSKYFLKTSESIG